LKATDSTRSRGPVNDVSGVVLRSTRRRTASSSELLRELSSFWPVSVRPCPVLRGSWLRICRISGQHRLFGYLPGSFRTNSFRHWMSSIGGIFCRRTGEIMESHFWRAALVVAVVAAAVFPDSDSPGVRGAALRAVRLHRPAQTGCINSAITIWINDLRHPASGIVTGRMELRYSTACETSWVRINNYAVARVHARSSIATTRTPRVAGPCPSLRTTLSTPTSAGATACSSTHPRGVRSRGRRARTQRPGHRQERPGPRPGLLTRPPPAAPRTRSPSRPAALRANRRSTARWGTTEVRYSPVVWHQNHESDPAVGSSFG
jgi:hypothetical protein